MESLLERIERWYAAQCDGEWEHRHAVRIETLDNPGWLVRVSLVGTSLEGVPFEPVEERASDGDWLDCAIGDAEWVGAGDARSLRRLLALFLDWAEGAASA